jgi:hypothetical protein
MKADDDDDDDDDRSNEMEMEIAEDGTQAKNGITRK